MSLLQKQTVCWQVVAPDALVWEHLGDESVLFDRRSGQTHLLPQITAECVALLQEQAMDLETICERLEVRLHPELENEARYKIDQLLRTLNDLGLIASISE